LNFIYFAIELCSFFFRIKEFFCGKSKKGFIKKQNTLQSIIIYTRRMLKINAAPSKLKKPQNGSQKAISN
jgi:hypothetical protein